ncbi:MAG TPA: ornithine carbamoyltransferase [Acidimicrobiales bacterium]|nr:ornithine carbamoyltransferase [Acidimicrobiales bacterium]
MNRHVLSMRDLSRGDITRALDAAERTDLQKVMAGNGAALIFEHPSTRTRNAAEMAIFGLGGHPLTIRGEEIGIDTRESAEDVAMTLSGYHSLIGARVARHSTLQRMADAIDHAGRDVPIVNLLSDFEHPSQALADLLTMRQHFGGLEGLTVSFIGDANNVARSLAIGCLTMGAKFRLGSPVGVDFSKEDHEQFAKVGGEVIVFHDPVAAATDADVLYSDVWVSMGEEREAQAKRAAFLEFTIDDALLSRASTRAVVMHCLPAHRGEEVSASVIDGPRSLTWPQAINRMHSMRGLIFTMLTKARGS